MVRRAKARARRPPRRDAGRPRGAAVADAVLDRTLEELATAGVGGLSVDRIARAAAVNKTSIYRRWPTREALLAAALGRVLSDLTLAQADTGTLRGDLLHLLASVAALLESPAGRALARAVFAEAEAPSLAALARQQLEASASGPSVALVTRAMARGEWREGADPVALLGMLVGALLHRRLFERQEPTRAWLESVVELALRGVQR